MLDIYVYTFCIPINSLNLYSGIQLSYLEIIWKQSDPFGSCFEALSCRTRAACGLELLGPTTEVIYPSLSVQPNPPSITSFLHSGCLEHELFPALSSRNFSACSSLVVLSCLDSFLIHWHQSELS